MADPVSYTIQGRGSPADSYTDDHSDNFDIYLPLWLARYNKSIFGSLYAAGIGYTLVKWLL